MGPKKDARFIRMFLKRKKLPVHEKAMHFRELINIYPEMRCKTLGIPFLQVDKPGLTTASTASSALEGSHGKIRRENREWRRALGRPSAIRFLELLSELLFDKITDDGQFITLALISFHHQYDPKHHAQGPHKQIDQDPQDRDEPHDKGDDEKPEERHKRLHRVEPNESILLLEQQKNKPGQPSQCVTKKSFEIFRHTQHCILIFIGHLEPPCFLVQVTIHFKIDA